MKQTLMTSLKFRAHLLGVVCFALGTSQAFAACDASGNPIQINSNCEDLAINNTVTGVTIDSAATVTPFFSNNAVTIGVSGNVTGTFLNQGTISEGFGYNGLLNQGAIGTLTNQGTITNSRSSTNYSALVNNGEIGTINNYGTISGTAGNLGYGAFAISQSGHIGTLNNTGTISAQNIAINFAQGISASIDTLNNSGKIEGGINGGGTSTFASAIVLGAANTIGTITNTGTIDHSVCDAGGTCYAAIENKGGTIGTITNLGTLTSGNTSNNGFGIINSVTGSIGTLNNSQSGLKYYGTLPANYNIVINSPTNYGSLAVSAESNSPTGPTKFGIYSGSTIAGGSTLYAAVLSGVSASNLAATTGTAGGDTFSNVNWKLANAGGGNVWDLSTTNNINTSPTVSGSNSGTKLAGAIGTSYKKVAPTSVTAPPVTTTTTAPTTQPPPVPTTSTTYTSVAVVTPTTTLVPTKTTTTTYTVTSTPTSTITTAPVVTTVVKPTTTPTLIATTASTTTIVKTDTPTSSAQSTVTTTSTIQSVTQTPVAPTLTNGSNFVDATQSLTSGQFNQLANVHAEGYSSNMTIGLEQMAHITNTVMDRIHNPLSARSGNSTVYEMDQGKYVWADAAAVKGTVNSYAGLGGFGYNLYDMIIGSDIYRTASGGLGVYGGVGYTSMTEPAQVTQNFNTTNYYAGLYGGKYLPYNFKLSGALGYMYGNTNASRNNPNVGLFTGGTANSNYNTNGAYGAFKFSRPFQATQNLTLTPYIGAAYSQLWMGQARESGGNDFNYTISNATAYTTVTFVGGEFIMPLTGAVKNPLSAVGFYRFGYDWFANSGYAHSVTANSPIFGSFNQVGADMGPALNLMGLGLQGYITQKVSARAGVVGSANTNGWQVGVGGELKWEL